MIPREGKSLDLDLMLSKEVGVMTSLLEKAGFKVVVATVKGEPIKGSAITFTPNLKLKDIKVASKPPFMTVGVGEAPWHFGVEIEFKRPRGKRNWEWSFLFGLKQEMDKEEEATVSLYRVCQLFYIFSHSDPLLELIKPL
jgi:hypothetical protein